MPSAASDDDRRCRPALSLPPNSSSLLLYSPASMLGRAFSACAAAGLAPSVPMSPDDRDLNEFD